MRPTCCAFFLADHDRHGHETQNEHEDGNGSPEEPRAIKFLQAIEQRRVAEANRQQQDRPQNPSPPIKQAERNQEQGDSQRNFSVILARDGIQNMPAVQLSHTSQTRQNTS